MEKLSVGDVFMRLSDVYIEQYMFLDGVL